MNVGGKQWQMLCNVLDAHAPCVGPFFFFSCDVHACRVCGKCLLNAAFINSFVMGDGPSNCELPAVMQQ